MEAERISFIDIPDSLKINFIVKIFGLLVAILACVIIAFSTRFFYEFGVIGLLFIVATGFQIYQLLKVMKGKYRKFTGICINIKKPEYTFNISHKSFGHFYGYSKIIVELSPEYQVEVPISNNLDIHEKDEVSFFSEKDSFIPKSDSMFYIENPLCVKIEKVKAVN